MNRDRVIGYIEQGVVIDHIPYGDVWKVVDILNLNKEQLGRVSLGDGYRTHKTIGLKGILKIEGIKLNDFELNKIALIAPNATISIIENGIIKEKRKVEVPLISTKLIHCPNPNCITKDIAEKEKPIIYHKANIFTCHYCGHSFSQEEVKLV